MTTKIMLPTLGESISDAVLTRWLKQPGEAVRTGDEIAELETSKATLALESPGTGVLLKIYVEAGTTIETGQLLAIVGRPGEVIDATQPTEIAAVETAGVEKPMQQPGSEPQQSKPMPEQRVSPMARKLAKELGVDINLVQPEKLGGRIQSEDVQRFADSRQPAAIVDGGQIPYHRIELNNVRRVLAARMLESAQNIPQFSISMDIEMDNFLQALDIYRQRFESISLRPSLTALLAVCLVPALRKHPWVNAHFDQNSILLYDTINLAVATSTPHGLMAPVLFQLEMMSLEVIVRQLIEKAARARQNNLSIKEISGSTISLSNLGMHGVTQFVPLINPPQSAILGIGMVHPVVLPLESGGTRHVKIMNITLTADHRVLDGEMAASFLSTLKSEIETVRVV